MEFSSNIQKSFKYLSGSLNTGEYSELVKYVFESFIISTKSGKFVVDLKADKFSNSFHYFHTEELPLYKADFYIFIIF